MKQSEMLALTGDYTAIVTERLRKQGCSVQTQQVGQYVTRYIVNNHATYDLYNDGNTAKWSFAGYVQQASHGFTESDFNPEDIFGGF